MKATSFLKQQHQEVKGLFAQYERASKRERKQEILERIRQALEGHAQIEEEIFYPAVADANVGREGKELVREARQEHEVAKALLGEISDLSPSDEQYDARVKVLQENVEHHVEEEEGELFSKAERAIPNDRMQELGTRLEERHETLVQPITTRFARGVKNLIFGEDEPAKRATPARANRTRRGPRQAGARPAARSAKGRSAKGGTAKKRGRKAPPARARAARKGANARTQTTPRGGGRATARGRRRTATGRSGRRRS